jgi:hypothetical protein
MDDRRFSDNTLRSLIPPFPPAWDSDSWAAWWHRWEAVGREAGHLDPMGALYTAHYEGDHLLFDLSLNQQGGADR